MNSVTVSKEELLKVLKENKEKHIQIYNDAMEGLRIEFRQKLERTLEDVRAQKEVEFNVRIETPVNHEEQYDEVIEMLEMSTESTITLSRGEFQSYVQDKWVSQSEKNFMRTLALSSSNSHLYQ